MCVCLCVCVCVHHIQQIFKQTDVRSMNKLCVNKVIYHDMLKDSPGVTAMQLNVCYPQWKEEAVMPPLPLHWCASDWHNVA
jgi:hypothetical protein